MFEWLSLEFEKISIAWLLISSTIGGAIGASLKFLFTFMIPENLKNKRELLAIQRKYSSPIFFSALELRKRLSNIVKLIHLIEIETGWLNRKDKSDYYFLSTIFVICQFLGWVQILRKTLIYLDSLSNSRTKSYTYGLDAVISSFSNPALTEKEPASSPDESEDKWIFSIWTQAIGDQMIVSENGNYRVLSFGEFTKRVKEEKEFREWIEPVYKLFDRIKEGELRYRRVVAIHAIVNAFIEMNDPKYLRSKRDEYFWEKLDDYQKAQVLEKIRGFNTKFNL